MNPYNYDEIDLRGKAIRLLRLLPGSVPEPISSEIIQAWLYPEEAILPYEALSYTWGSAEAPKSILVNGKCLAVTTNLHEALEQLRYVNQDRILWVDAICINQDDNKERSHQVQQMGDLFKKAERVVFWLGKSTPIIDDFMDVFGGLQQTSLSYPYKGWSQNDESWEIIWNSSVKPLLESPKSFDKLQQGFFSILDRPWFKRVWILQEVTIARAAVVCCGSKTIASWLLSVAPRLLGIKPGYHEQAVIDVMPGPWKGSSWWSKSQDLYTLLMKFGDSQATETRDIIYALKGMSSDATNEPSLYPDYNKPERQLVQDVILFIYPLRDEYLALIKPPVTVRDLIRDLKGLCRRIALNCHEIYSHDDTKALIQHKSPQIQSQIFVLSLSFNPAEDIAKHLLQEWGMKVNIAEQHLTVVAWHLLSRDMAEIVFRHMDTGITLITAALIMAAQNEDCGDRILELFSQYAGGSLRVTEDVLKAAAQNHGCGWKILEILLQDKQNQAFLTNAVLDNVDHRGAGVKTLEVIGRFMGDDDELTKMLLLQALRIPPSDLLSTQHEDLSKEDMSVWLTESLLVHREKLSDTLDILQGAVANRDNAGKLTRLLFQYWGKENFTITNDILWAAVRNKEGGHEALEVLFEQSRHHIRIPQPMIDYIVSSGHDGIRELFTRYAILPRQSENLLAASRDSSLNCVS
ncbi:heterokaryon incompatibility domain-containing protein [Trichoderma chlorosporum]